MYVVFDFPQRTHIGKIQQPQIHQKTQKRSDISPKASELLVFFRCLFPGDPRVVIFVMSTDPRVVIFVMPNDPSVDIFVMPSDPRVVIRNDRERVMTGGRLSVTALVIAALSVTALVTAE